MGIREMAGRITFVLLVLSLGASEVVAWMASTTGPRCTLDRVNAVAVDHVGNVITAGAVNLNDYGPDFAVVKYDATSGRELWRRLIDGPSQRFDHALAVAVDDSGNVVAAGQIYTATGYDILVAKLAEADGSIVWQRQLRNRGDGYDEPARVAMDHSQDVIVAGGVDALDNGSHPEMFVAKLAGIDGTEVWRSVAERSFNPNGSFATAIVVDSSGSLYLGGHEDEFSGASSVVFRVASDNGTVHWRLSLKKHFLAGMTQVAGGDLIAASSSALARLRAADGSDVWRVEPNDVAYAFAADQNGDLLAVAAGHVRKLRGDNGQEIWGAEEPPAEFRELIAADRSGHAILARDTEMIKRDGITGTVLWSSNDHPNPPQVLIGGLTTDDAGNAIAIGYDHLTDGGYTVVKLSGVDGDALSKPICSGDCDASGTVSVEELVRGVNIALEKAPSCDCRPFDTNRDGGVQVDELIRAVSGVFAGCPG
jgi:outer membrane protein assembly factor BamB